MTAHVWSFQCQLMKRRPLSILIIGWLFIAAGSVGLVYHLTEWNRSAPVDYELVLILLIRLAAVVGGAFLLRGCNWARWLLVSWMAYHIVLSVLHSVQQLVMHTLLFGVITYVLFCPRSSAYLRGICNGSSAVNGNEIGPPGG